MGTLYVVMQCSNYRFVHKIFLPIELYDSPIVISKLSKF